MTKTMTCPRCQATVAGTRRFTVELSMEHHLASCPTRALNKENKENKDEDHAQRRGRR